MKTLHICTSRGPVSIAHTIRPHNLTFISLRRKGFNQDFIKRYLCNALRPPATGLFSSFIFSRGLCSRRKGESAFRVFFSGKCSIPRDWTWESVCAEASRNHLLTFILTRWKIITENSQTKMSWTKFMTDHGQSLNTFAKHCIALQQFPLLLLPYSEGCPFWNYKLLPASFESHPFLNCKCKLQIVTCACLFWGAPPSTPSLWGVKAFAQQGAWGSHPGNRAI